MDTLLDPSPGNAPDKPLLVMLPGALNTPDDLQREGFVQAVRELGLDADVLLVDADMRYYTDQTIIERLRRQVIEPAQAAGQRRIWMAGISLGGMGSLMYARKHPDDIEGLMAIAAYLGPRNISIEIQRAGGLAQWPDNTPEQDAADSDRRLWRWLQGYASAARPQAATPLRRPPLFWGYGLDDRFAISHRLVAEALPDERVFTAEGGHVWPVWAALWRQMLARLPWPRIGQ